MHVVWASLSFLHISCSVLVGVVEFRKLFKEREEGKKERKRGRGVLYASIWVSGRREHIVGVDLVNFPLTIETMKLNFFDTLDAQVFVCVSVCLSLGKVNHF